MRIKLVLAVSVAAATLILSGYTVGYWQGSPLNIVVQPPSDCMPMEELEPPLF